MAKKQSRQRQHNLNISGLRNQPGPSVQRTRVDPTDSHNNDIGEHSNCEHSSTGVLFDSAKPDLTCEELSGDESDVEEASEFDF